MGGLIAAACGLTYYFHAVLQRGTVFTHLFYVPIVLAAMWWKRRGVVVAAFLALFLILSYGWFRTEEMTSNDYLRASVFLLVGIIVASLSERMEQAELASRQLASIVTSSQNAIIGLDLDGTMTSWNRAAEQLYGYQPEEVLGRNVSMLTSTDSPEESRPLSDRIHSDQPVDRYESVHLKKDGSPFPVFVTVSPVRDTEERITGGSIIARDISDHRRLEKEILEISEQERRRIGQDLHDELGQMLTGLLCLTRNLAQCLKDEEHPEAEKAAEIPPLLKEAIQSTRILARGLSPVPRHDYGLAASLRELTERVAWDYQVRCTFEEEGQTISPDDETADQLYRICQEALTNAVRHAHASSLRVRLEQPAHRLILTVTDDGRGFSQLPGSDGLGLRIMRYRASIINARLEIDSTPGGGTRVCCSVNTGRIPETI